MLMWADMIIDSDPLISKFISIPKDFGQLNCNAFVAGIIEAILDGYQFVLNLLFLSDFSVPVSLLMAFRLTGIHCVQFSSSNSTGLSLNARKLELEWW